MPSPPTPDWALVRRRYEATDDPVAIICAEAGIDQRQLDQRRRQERWRRANPRPFPPPRRPAPAAAAAPAPAPAPAVPAGPDAAAAPPSSLVPPAPATDPAPAPPAPARRLPSTPAARRRLLDRLVAAISLKLEQLERRMTLDLDAPAAGDALTATDHERETRAIGALIDNLEKITEIESGLGRTKSGKPDAASADLADEADRCRRELAERLQRIVEAAAREG